MLEVKELFDKMSAIQGILFLKAEGYSKDEIARILGVEEYEVSAEMAELRKRLKHLVMNAE
jgi:DNA-directed RNA polymerase specialized sigma24 family protein